MKELTTYEERKKWLSNKIRIGMLNASELSPVQSDIWTMELFKDNSDIFYIFITTDSDESWFVKEITIS